jgi:hypothetical protein
MLLETFAGGTRTMREVFEQHQVGRPFVSANYKETLKQMESKGTIQCVPDAATRRKNTFADDVRITFPPKGGSLGKVKH